MRRNRVRLVTECVTVWHQTAFRGPIDVFKKEDTGSFGASSEDTIPRLEPNILRMSRDLSEARIQPSSSLRTGGALRSFARSQGRLIRDESLVLAPAAPHGSAENLAPAKRGSGCFGQRTSLAVEKCSECCKYSSVGGSTASGVWLPCGR